MTSWSVNYRGYTIHGTVEGRRERVTYQSPNWPTDPRIVKAPSRDTAERWIREELARLKVGTEGVAYLAQAREEVVNPLTRRVHFRKCWRLVDEKGEDLVLGYFKDVGAAREFCLWKKWALLEHFDY